MHAFKRFTWVSSSRKDIYNRLSCSYAYYGGEFLRGIQDKSIYQSAVDLSEASAPRNVYNSTIGDESIEEEVDIMVEAEVRNAHQLHRSFACFVLVLSCKWTKESFRYFCFQSRKKCSKGQPVHAKCHEKG